MKFNRISIIALPIIVLLSLSPVFSTGSISRLSKRLISGKGQLKGKKIAILAFPYHDGKISSGSSIVSERLTTELVGYSQIRVMERRLLKKILEEQKLSETGVIDTEMAQKIGTVLGVDVIVTGTLIDIKDGKTDVNARVLDAQTGEILSAANDTIQRSWTDEPRFIVEKSEVQQEPKVETLKTPAEQSMSPEDPELQPTKEESSSRPQKALKLSNESFPPGRRLYHNSNATGGKKTKKTYRERNEEDANDSRYDDAYDEGYLDAQREYLQKSDGQTETSVKKDSSSSGTGRKLGERRTEYESTTYRINSPTIKR